MLGGRRGRGRGEGEEGVVEGGGGRGGGGGSLFSHAAIFNPGKPIKQPESGVA